MKKRNKKTRQPQVKRRPLRGRQAPAPNRTYKSRMFEMIFSNKKELLELYNAINGTNYTNTDDGGEHSGERHLHGHAQRRFLSH